MKHQYKAWPEGEGARPTLDTCNDAKLVEHTMEPQSVNEAGEIVWTYDVTWETSNIKWASRWDTYLLMGDEQIHWFSIVNSLMIVLFLTGDATHSS